MFRAHLRIQNNIPHTVVYTEISAQGPSRSGQTRARVPKVGLFCVAGASSRVQGPAS